MKNERREKGLYWDRAWSLVSGCTHVSPGCDNCWAAREAHMRQVQENTKIRAKYEGLTTAEGRWNGKVRLLEENLYLPLRKQKPVVWAVWNDLLHEEVPDSFVDEALAVMAFAERQTFLVLTKRAPRMADYFTDEKTRSRVKNHLEEAIRRFGTKQQCWNLNRKLAAWSLLIGEWPPRNVWLGVTAEDQKRAEERLPYLLRIQTANLFVSAEPLLGPLNLTPWLNGLKLVIAGGESGPGARPTHPDWLRSLRDQCLKTGASFYFKGWGEWLPGPLEAADNCLWYEWPDGERSFRVGRYRSGRLLDGRTWEGCDLFER